MTLSFYKAFFNKVSFLRYADKEYLPNRFDDFLFITVFDTALTRS